MNWHIKNWFRIGHNVSWKLSKYSLMTMLYFVPAFKTKGIYGFVKKKHEYVLGILDGIVPPILSTFSDNSKILESEPVQEKIWTMWWQGEQNAPDVVRLCFASIRKHAGNASVTVLDKDNYSDYVTVPEHIRKRFEDGRMPIAVFADYIRVSLLEKYGGLWLDATILVSQDIPEDFYSRNFFTLHTRIMDTPFISNNRIYCCVLGGRKGSSLYGYVRKSMEAFWAKYDTLVDYYLLDYIIMYGYLHNEEIKNLIDSLPNTSETLYGIVDVLNKPKNENNIQRLMKENILSKLNWRIDCKLSRNGKETNYGYLKSIYL